MIRKLLLTALLASGLTALTASAAAPSKTDLVASYAKISAALAADDLAAAKTAATDFAAKATAADKKALAEKATLVAKAPKIEGARDSFKGLSTAVEPLAAGEKDFVVMNCPMAAADWVQAKGAVKNPYFGKSMLACGAPKQTK